MQQWCCAVLCCSVTSGSLRLHGHGPLGSFVHGDSPGKNTWSGLPRPPPGDFPNPGIEFRSPALQADSLPSEPPEKPLNTGVGSLSFLQGIFPTQELNRGLLYCRWILYQLSYLGSPDMQLHVSYLEQTNFWLLPQTRCDEDHWDSGVWEHF